MSFDYFYGQQSDLFTFYRVPKVLFTNEKFWNISADAKMLYGILLDRMSLSAKNGWIDKNGRVYIIFALPYDLLRSPEITSILKNSDFIYMLNQASDDRSILAQQLNISPHQLSYVTNSGEGEALIDTRFANMIREAEKYLGYPYVWDGNLTLVDDAGSPTKSGKQFITAVTKNGNCFYIIIDRDNKSEETVHFLNQVDEADLLKQMDEEVTEFTKPVEETRPEAVETVSEITEPTPKEKPKSMNMLPALLTLIMLACGGGFFVFKKVQEKKKEQEAAKPDPDADYVDDDEDYGYDPEFEDDDADSSVDEDDNEPV